MLRGPIPLNVHAALEPIMGALLIAAPWIFGFDDLTDARTISIIVGAAVLVAAATTDWRWSLVRLIPLRVHFALDLLLGAFLVLSPFIFGFSDVGAAARFTIILGAAEMLAALATNWEPEEAVEPRGQPPGGVSPVR